MHFELDAEIIGNEFSEILLFSNLIYYCHSKEF